MAMTVMVFIFGGGLMVYQKLFKKTKVSQTIANDKASEIPAFWYEQYFGKGVCDDEVCKPEADPDSDKLTNAQEYFYNTNPLNYRTVGDELNDGELVAAGFDPSKKGRVVFTENAIDTAIEDSALGESLVFDEDIKKVIADAQDISKVVLPLVDDAELQITDEQTEEVYLKYFNDLRSKVAKYFSKEDVAEVNMVLQAGSGVDVSQIQSKAKLLSAELKTVTVPAELLQFHKYNIAFYSLLAVVIENPTDENINHWYDSAQAFMAVQQKLNLEKQLLAKEFGQ
jgi:hypothetical protein